ncbi:MAG TPA: class I SAM-dependent methyltransferase [Opitutaceae bacterium]|nr:class I SAM-dependent methyltransferase [Opitutaceae bacterium]
MANVSGDSVKKNYDTLVSKLKQEMSTEDAALRFAVGAEFISVGKIERDLLISLGLRPDQTVVDVGCGSGRLAYPLTRFLESGRFIGFDVVTDLVEYARKITNRPDWLFETTSGTTIPLPDETADFISFFSVLTHLRHEESFFYLKEAKRVLRPEGRIVFSFIEFQIPCHWDIFQYMLSDLRPERVHNQFISRDAIAAWAGHLGLEVVGIHDGDKPHIPLSETVQWDNGNVMVGMGNLGQSVAVLRKQR